VHIIDTTAASSYTTYIAGLKQPGLDSEPKQPTHPFSNQPSHLEQDLLWEWEK
jgi:hypothetical protein